MSNEIVNPAVDSADMIFFKDWMAFNPFGCATIQETLQNLWHMAMSVNRASLTYAYAVGRFADVAQLKRKYGISTLRELAKEMGTSENTIGRCRVIYELLTERELSTLATRGISVNALLAIAQGKKLGQEEEARQILDMMLTGASFTEKEVKSELARLVIENARPYQLLPGGEPPADGVVDTTLQELTMDAEPPMPPAEKIIEAEVVSDCKDGEAAADTARTLNKRDIKVVCDAALQDLTGLRRELASITENLEEELRAAHDKENIILGDEELYDKFQTKISDIYGLARNAAEALIRVFIEGKKFGYVTEHAKLVVPESTIIEEVFRTEN